MAKSMLMSYMHRKHRYKVEGMLMLALFAIIIMGLATLGATSTGAVTGYTSGYAYNLPQQNSYYSDYSSYNYNNQYQPVSSTGLVVGQSSAITAIWLIAIGLLIPVELSLRKK